MSYFSDAPLGTVQRMIYDDKIVKSPVRDLRDAEAIKLMASGELPPHTGMVEMMDPRLRDSALRRGREFAQPRAHLVVHLWTVLAGVYKPLKHLFLCQVATLDRDFRPIGNGMVFGKRWPYTKIMNYYFLEVTADLRT